MNAPKHAEDKFGALMTMRVEPVEIEGLPPLEIRERPVRDIKPLLDQAGKMDNQEFTNRLLGLSLYLDGEQLTYDRVLSMSVGMIRKLADALPAIMRVYGLHAEADALANEPASADTPGAEGAEPAVVPAPKAKAGSVQKPPAEPDPEAEDEDAETAKKKG